MIRVLPILAALCAVVALGPASADNLGPGTVVGKVTNTPSKTKHRRVFVQAGREKWALHCGETTLIFHNGVQVSVHDIDEGMYVHARGVRIGRQRLMVDRLDIAGDRLAFRKSDAYRKSAPEGYFLPR